MRLQISKKMSHNSLSFNQLAEWTPSNSSEDENLVNDYFDCLIECDSELHICKRVCREMLI